jgi:hypothetical protein
VSTLDPILWTAGGVALLHTVLGPDHYLPFVALGRARRWSTARTLWTTAACGLGHIGVTLLLGFGVALGGWSLASVTGWEGLRGDAAAWLLLGFGVAYALWGLKQLSRSTPAQHSHAHSHADGTTHDHGHDHHAQHVHPHEQRGWVGWSLFIVFLLGPCEPLIPLMLVPASQRDPLAIMAVAGVFLLVTLVTMAAVVWLLTRGIESLQRPDRFQAERYGHVAAGATVACCGLAMLLGL